MSSYSRQSAAKAIRSYYIFLATKLGAIRPSYIVEPPVGGWRNITTASLVGLGTGQIFDSEASYMYACDRAVRIVML